MTLNIHISIPLLLILVLVTGNNLFSDSAKTTMLAFSQTSIWARSFNCCMHLHCLFPSLSTVACTYTACSPHFQLLPAPTLLVPLTFNCCMHLHCLFPSLSTVACTYTACSPHFQLLHAPTLLVPLTFNCCLHLHCLFPSLSTVACTYTACSPHFQLLPAPTLLVPLSFQTLTLFQASKLLVSSWPILNNTKSWVTLALSQVHFLSETLHCFSETKLQTWEHPKEDC